MITKEYVNDLAYTIIGSAIDVHKNLGPGLLESVYHACLYEEITQSGIFVKSQVNVPVSYKGKQLGNILRLDLLVADIIIVELKSVEVMIPLYKAQLLSYLKLTGKPKGLLINFNCENISQSYISMVTEQYAQLPVK